MVVLPVGGAAVRWVLSSVLQLVCYCVSKHAQIKGGNLIAIEMVYQIKLTAFAVTR